MALTVFLILSLSSCSKVKKKNPTTPSASAIQAPTTSVNVNEGVTSQPYTAAETSKPSSVSQSLADELNKLDGKKRGWGQGTTVDKYNRPVSCDEYQNKYGKYGAIFIKENTNKIYLTFDEGYENGYTPKILDTLKEKNVKAVFFVTYDYAKRNPDLIRRMINEGHVVGNHSYTHPSMPTLSYEKAESEITKLHNYVKSEFNYTMTLFRPPMGEYSERTLALTQKLGYRSVFWSFAYADWDTKKQMGADKAYEKVTKAAHNGAVYLLHAVSKDNAQILGSVIDYFQKQGFVIEKLS